MEFFVLNLVLADAKVALDNEENLTVEILNLTLAK